MLESILTIATDNMDHSIDFWYNCRIQTAKAEAALDVVHQQLKLVNLGSAEKFGIIDLADRHFVLFENTASSPEDPPRDDGSYNKLTVDCFLRHLRPADQQFISVTLDQAHCFLQRQRPEKYPNFRLTLDFCLDIQPRPFHRFMVHLRYLTPGPQFPNGLCLFWAYRIDRTTVYTPPFRAFCRFPGLKPVLFRSGKGHFPCFSEKRRPLLLSLREGRGVKQIAQEVGCSEATVANTLANLRRLVYVANNTQLVHYYECYYS